MNSKTAGLRVKYKVERLDGKPLGWCFVLAESDPLAPFAITAYAAAARDAGYLELARDLDRKAMQLTGPPVGAG